MAKWSIFKDVALLHKPWNPDTRKLADWEACESAGANRVLWVWNHYGELQECVVVATEEKIFGKYDCVRIVGDGVVSVSGAAFKEATGYELQQVYQLDDGKRNIN